MANGNNNVTLLVYMSTDKKAPTQPKSSTGHQLFVVGTFLDTTWRMFIPVVGLAILGIWIDRTYGPKPLWTIIGIIMGTVIAGLLVRAQLQKGLEK